MCKLSSLITIWISIILITALILSGCASSGGSNTSAPTTANVPNQAPPITSSIPNQAPPPSTAAPPVTPNTPTNGTVSSTQPINIGIECPMSGVFATFGPYETDGVKMLVDDINASGGLLGRQVQAIFKDDASDPSRVPGVASELQSAGVVGIVGSLYDGCSVELFQWAAANKMLVVGPENGTLSYRTTQFSKYVFFWKDIAAVEGKILAQSIASQNDVNTAYFIGADLSFAHDAHDSFWANMKQLKPSVKDLGETWTGLADMDFTNVISATLARKPDMVINYLGGPPWPTFCQQASQFGYFAKTKTATSLNLGADTSVAFGKNYPVGIQCIIQNPFWLDTPEMQAFTKEFYSKYNFYPGNPTLDYYMSTLSLIEAIKNAGTTDTDQIISSLETLTLNSTPVGAISYNDYDHQANMPLWYGTSAYTPDYPIAIGTNLVKFQDNLYPTKDEILALRAAK